ncbi:uncharacterized protein DSM5745_01954 [Aspergillus mulundensis]|uniref:VWFA domain-containing protein n=1 Tax=Aspergillus mulundensis TaxID=1810919 RepID=A0A3D8SV87_9EURO|nr:Uncharacterized protein DSM5745_01954 [Aspergillus mulundensis]RDW90179.1 Uncharacterized protein DSM5745_01954 [Aspergillus mulundensis]
MGNCHSSHDNQHAVPAQRRSVGSKSLHSHVQSVGSPNQPYQAQNTHQPSQDSGADVWSPPPYSSTAATTTPVAPVNTSRSTDIVPNDTAYAFLSTFDTVFLVDDSTSMRGKRWHEAENAIAAIAPICTHWDADGIDIYFLNHRNQSRFGSGGGNAGGYKNVTDASGVREIFKSVSPSGATPVGTRLHQILNPYLRDLKSLTAQGRESELKPLNIIVITDGEFTDDAETVIVNTAKQLDHPNVQAVPWQVGIQFFQVGDDEHARKYLEALDDELVKRRSLDGIRDIVDTVPWKGDRGNVLNAEGILKCVLGAVNKKYDKAKASH